MSLRQVGAWCSYHVACCCHAFDAFHIILPLIIVRLRHADAAADVIVTYATAFFRCRFAAWRYWHADGWRMARYYRDTLGMLIIVDIDTPSTTPSRHGGYSRRRLRHARHRLMLPFTSIARRDAMLPRHLERPPLFSYYIRHRRATPDAYVITRRHVPNIIIYDASSYAQCYRIFACRG